MHCFICAFGYHDHVQHLQVCLADCRDACRLQGCFVEMHACSIAWSGSGQYIVHIMRVNEMKLVVSNVGGLQWL